MIRRNNRRSFPRRFNILRLEDRITPAIATSWDALQGALTVTSDGSDSISVSKSSDRRVTVNGVGAVDSTGLIIETRLVHSITVHGGPGSNVIDISGVDLMSFSEMAASSSSRTFTPRAATSIQNLSAMCVEIDGGGGSDTVTGSPFDDLIMCTSGADDISAGDGDDLIVISSGAVSGLTVRGGWGGASCIFDNTYVPGALMSVNADVATGDQTISYGTLSMSFSKIQYTYTQQKCDDVRYILTSSGGGTGGPLTGTVEITQAPGDPRTTVSVETDAAGVPGRLKWDKVSLKRGITSSMDAWKYRVDPSESPTDILCTGTGSELTVNNFGLPFSTTTAGVQVQGMAPVTFTGSGSVECETTIYDDAGLAELKASGVVPSFTTSLQPDGSVLAAFSLQNQNAVNFRDVTLTWLKRNGAGGVYSSSPGVTVNAETSEGLSAAALAMHQKPDKVILFDRIVIPVGDKMSGSIWTPRDKGDRDPWHGTFGIAKSVRDSWPHGQFTLECAVGDRSYRIDITKYFERNDTPTEPQFIAVTGTNGSPDAPVTLLACDASGSMVLSTSTASNIDYRVKTFYPSPHLFLNGMMVDMAPDGVTSGDGSVSNARMSLDGRYVVFESTSTNLVSGLQDTNGGTDVFLRDTMLGVTTCLSKNATSTGNSPSFDAHISVDGSEIVFRSLASNLVAGVADGNGKADLFNYGVGTSGVAELSCLSVTGTGTQTANGSVLACDVNGDARSLSTTITWITDSTNDGANTPATHNYYVKKHLGSVKYNEFTAALQSNTFAVTVSLDGSSIIVVTDANLTPNLPLGVSDTNNARDVLKINTATNAVTCLSLNFAHSATADGPSPAFPTDAPAVSLDGSHVAFSSFASNLVTDVLSPATDGMYLVLSGLQDACYRLDTVGASSWGADNRAPSITADGQHVNWLSPTSYNPAVAANGKIQSWVKDCYDGKEYRTASILVSASPGGTMATEHVKRSVIVGGFGGSSHFSTAAGNIVIGDTNNQDDVFRTNKISAITIKMTSTTANTVEYDSQTDSIVLKDAQGIVVSSHTIGFAQSLYIQGRDGVDDALTIDMSSGLERLTGGITVSGGTGTDSVTVLDSVGSTDRVYMYGGSNGAGGFESYQASLSYPFMKKLRMCLAFSSVESCTDGTNAPEWDARSFSPTTTITKSGNDLVVSGGGYASIKQGHYAVSNFTASVTLNPGNDTCTIDTSGAPAAAGERLTIIGYGGDDNIAAKGTPVGLTHTGYLLGTGDAPISGSSVVEGNDGDDTFTVGFGGGTLNGGAGGDAYFVGGRYVLSAGVPIRVTVTDSSGDDTLDFSKIGGGVTVQLDNTGVQAISPTTELELTGQFENGTGSPFDDQFTVKQTTFARSLDGGSQVTLAGDKLFVDVQGKAAGIVDGQVRATGMAPVSFTNFENVTLLNNAATLQVADVTINDGALQRSRLTKMTVVFTRGDFSFTNNDVAAALSLTSNSNGNTIPFNASSSTTTGYMVVTITFPPGGPDYGSLPNGAFTLHVLASHIDSANVLDGNGDGVVGTVGEDYATPPTLIFRSFGDFNGDRISDLIDFAAFREAFNLGPSPIFDLEGDGVVGLLDFAGFRDRFNLVV